jgi:uncharacterized protein (TIGR02270 family)
MPVNSRVTAADSARPLLTIADVVRHHADEAAILWTSRARLVAAPRVRLFELQRADDRLAAHLDGLAVAGDEGWKVCQAALGDRTAGAMFASAAVAVEFRQAQRLEQLFTLTEGSPGARDELTSAFVWVERRYLQGTVAALLKSAEPSRRLAGIAACGAHRVDPGLAAGPWLTDEDPLVRAGALRAAGEVGCLPVLGACKSALSDPDADCQFWAAWSAVLLGDRGLALNALARSGLAAGPRQSRAFALALQSMDLGDAHAVLQKLAADPAGLRLLLQGSGIAGDPMYVPWLIGRMADDVAARLAGEAFTLITGADLDALQLARPRPEAVESEPGESPEDESVAMDPDEDLPWPDAERVRAWWNANAERFQPGVWHFMGAPGGRAQCLEVLKNGYQRQRILAAHSLCLLGLGTPLFNTSAPAWRQRALLAHME